MWLKVGRNAFASCMETRQQALTLLANPETLFLAPKSAYQINILFHANVRSSVRHPKNAMINELSITDQRTIDMSWYDHFAT